jgi:hypothetical protein
MIKEDIISIIKNCIKKAHKNNSLGISTSITRNYLVDNLNNIQPTDIHVALLELHDKGEIEYNSDSGIILLLN